MKTLSEPFNPLLHTQSSDDSRDVYNLNGKIVKTHDTLIMPNRVIVTPDIPFKGIMSTLIDKQVKTTLGFQAKDFGRLTFCKKLYMFPLAVVVQNFVSLNLDEARKNNTKVYHGELPKALSIKLDKPIISFFSKEPSGMYYFISSEYRAAFIEDCLMVSGFFEDEDSLRTQYHDDKDAFCKDIAKFSDITFVYCSNYEFWVKAAELTNINSAHTYLANIMNISRFVFELLKRKYKEMGIFLADAKFEFGLDDNGKLIISGEIGTPNTCRLLSLKDLEESNNLVSADKDFVVKYFSEVGYDIETMSVPPTLPSKIVERISLKYIDIAKHFCGEDVIQKYIHK